MSPEKKKSLFEKAIDALTDRDEKEAEAKASAAAAKKEAEDRARMAADQAAAEKTTAEKAAADKIAAEKAATMKAEMDQWAAEQMDAMKAANEKAAAEKAAATATKKGVVMVRSLRIRADHNTTSEVIGGLVDGNEVTILSSWSDGKNTWAKLDKGWAAMVYDGATYIKLV